MKITIRKPMLIGDRYYDTGATLDIADERAKVLIELDHAKPYTPPMETATAPAPQEKAVSPKTKKEPMWLGNPRLGATFF